MTLKDKIQDGWEDDHLWELQLRIWKNHKFHPRAFEGYEQMIDFYESQGIDVDFHKRILNIYRRRYDVERARELFKKRIMKLRDDGKKKYE